MEQMQQGQMQAPNPEIMSPVIQAHIPELEQMQALLEGKLGDAYERVVTAGMKMMYAPENAEMIQGLILNDEIPVANKLGEGIANLLIMMDNQGNGTIPKEILIPVGVTLMFEAADYLYEVGIEVTEEDLGKGLEIMIEDVFVGYGIDPAQMEKVIDDMGKKLGFEGEAAEAEIPGPDVGEEAAFEQGFQAEQAARGRM